MRMVPCYVFASQLHSKVRLHLLRGNLASQRTGLDGCLVATAAMECLMAHGDWLIGWHPSCGFGLDWQSEGLDWQPVGVGIALDCCTLSFFCTRTAGRLGPIQSYTLHNTRPATARCLPLTR